MKKLFLAIALLTLGLAACQAKTVELTPNGEQVEVKITAARYDSVYVQFPESEYTQRFTFTLGEDFIDFEDPTWWERFHSVLERAYLDERDEEGGEFFRSEIHIHTGDEPEEEDDPYLVYEVPTVEWLQENVNRGLKNPFLYVEIELPTDGIMKTTVSVEDYTRYIEKYPNRQNDPIETMHLMLGEQNIYALWGIFPSWPVPEQEQVFLETLEDIQETLNGVLVYRYADGGSYLVIQLPEELLSLTADDLAESSYTTTLTVDILQK